MTVLFGSIASGSSGNALLVEVGQTRLMVDCGLGLGLARERIAQRGWDPESISAILVTHEHSDHISGVAKFARKHGTKVLGSYGTLSFLGDTLASQQCLEIDGHQAFEFGEIWIEPYYVPHDAKEPLQYVVGDGSKRLGILTDVGRATPHIETMLTECDALVLECNHDEQMLKEGPYQDALKKRVAGPFGHLSNSSAAELLARLDTTRLKHLIAAHLSQQNNTEELAKNALAKVMNCSPDWIGVATQELGFAWREI
jgi:phosphoribosyl 1,2-cyclic phosphodiesterase